ncbi:alpha/beta fold hydrolase [Dankookia sp. P2]|uniref:alpha/beta fold hydrolase n=1 Tax=Dankookia sp. P2 TaxID=3423955 RepID=UPI003D67EC02
MFCQIGDIAIHATVEGPAQAPAVLLLHSLGTNLHMWDPQAAALARRFRVIRMDMRGHGLTEATPGPYTMAMLAGDALGLLDSLGIAEAHVGGVSIGGHIALQMAARAPGRVISLIPCDTALEFGGGANWQERMDLVAKGGVAAVADATMGRWVLDHSLATSKGLKRMLLGTDPTGWLGCAAALRDTSAADIAGKIACPTTILVGDRDQSTPLAAAEAIRDAIPGSALVLIPEAAHIPNSRAGARGDPRRPAPHGAGHRPARRGGRTPAWRCASACWGGACRALGGCADGDGRALPRLHPGGRLGPRLDPARPVRARPQPALPRHPLRPCTTTTSSACMSAPRRIPA